jgi:hypothetical protein
LEYRNFTIVVEKICGEDEKTLGYEKITFR